MNITLKRFKSLHLSEMTFVISMMGKYGGLKIEEPQSTYNNNNNNNNTNNNKKKTKYRNNQKKPPKIIKNHDDCTSKEPCLYDFDCPGWEKCEDDKFLQYRLIIKKCEK